MASTGTRWMDIPIPRSNLTWEIENQLEMIRVNRLLKCNDNYDGHNVLKMEHTILMREKHTNVLLDKILKVKSKITESMRKECFHAIKKYFQMCIMDHKIVHISLKQNKNSNIRNNNNNNNNNNGITLDEFFIFPCIFEAPNNKLLYMIIRKLKDIKRKNGHPYYWRFNHYCIKSEICGYLTSISIKKLRGDYESRFISDWEDLFLRNGIPSRGVTLNKSKKFKINYPFGLDSASGFDSLLNEKIIYPVQKFNDPHFYCDKTQEYFQQLCNKMNINCIALRNLVKKGIEDAVNKLRSGNGTYTGGNGSDTLIFTQIRMLDRVFLREMVCYAEIVDDVNKEIHYIPFCIEENKLQRYYYVGQLPTPWMVKCNVGLNHPQILFNALTDFKTFYQQNQNKKHWWCIIKDIKDICPSERYSAYNGLSGLSRLCSPMTMGRQMTSNISYGINNVPFKPHVAPAQVTPQVAPQIQHQQQHQQQQHHQQQQQQFGAFRLATQMPAVPMSQTPVQVQQIQAMKMQQQQQQHHHHHHHQYGDHNQHQQQQFGSQIHQITATQIALGTVQAPAQAPAQAQVQVQLPIQRSIPISQVHATPQTQVGGQLYGVNFQCVQATQPTFVITPFVTHNVNNVNSVNNTNNANNANNVNNTKYGNFTSTSSTGSIGNVSINGITGFITGSSIGQSQQLQLSCLSHLTQSTQSSQLSQLSAIQIAQMQAKSMTSVASEANSSSSSSECKSNSLNIGFGRYDSVSRGSVSNMTISSTTSMNNINSNGSEHEEAVNETINVYSNRNRSERSVNGNGNGKGKKNRSVQNIRESSVEYKGDNSVKNVVIEDKAVISRSGVTTETSLNSGILKYYNENKGNYFEGSYERMSDIGINVVNYCIKNNIKVSEYGRLLVHILKFNKRALERCARLKESFDKEKLDDFVKIRQFWQNYTSKSSKYENKEDTNNLNKKLVNNNEDNNINNNNNNIIMM